MGLNYHDLSILRFVQKRVRVPLSKVALQFEKNEISIRRTIDQINSYSPTPLIEIKKSYCLSRLSYREFVDFIGRISMEDYVSSHQERIRTMIVAIFFHGYINASALYESWGFSLTTKKQDTAHLRTFLAAHGLSLVTLKKKGLAISGDELQLRFLVIDILHPLLEFTAENQIEARFANTPIEKQTFDLAAESLIQVSPEAVQQLDGFLSREHMSLNYPSKKFLLLFICILRIRPVTDDMTFCYRLPLAPLNLPVSSDPRTNALYNVALSMMNFSRSLDFPFDPQLWHVTETFTEQVVAGLPEPFIIREELIQELYNYFYREITLDHFHCTFVDKTVENTRGQFSFLYQLLDRYQVLFAAAYQFHFMDEHLSTLTLLLQKHILRNQLVTADSREIVIVTSINFERISFFLEQAGALLNLRCQAVLNINEIHRLAELSYDCIFCFSTRIYNILKAQNAPVFKVNFFLTEEDIDQLAALGFSRQRHRFLASSFVTEIAGKSEEEIVKYLKENYGNHFV